jgi:hypothetical protein
LVMHAQNRAKETEGLGFDPERALQLEKELASPNFRQACRRAIRPVEQP